MEESKSQKSENRKKIFLLNRNKGKVPQNFSLFARGKGKRGNDEMWGKRFWK
ncbi:hypothetical protein [Pseudarcicella hirudinis]|uniref:hypothetical protein n=1 Tax=Pseudarcicella hirudinis TaxID=1079859 RepID=UPI00366CDABA